MSTYWSLHCKTCSALSESDFNHGEHIIRGIVKAYPHIKAALEADDSHYLEVSVLGHGEELISFLHAHYPHDLELYNEYGQSEPLIKEPKVT